MRLRNLFMILLLCMTVGVLGTSCTGDDGATGPKGDPGADAEITDEVIDQIVEQVDIEDKLQYAFLSNWGYPDGISCSDLEMSDPFPGPEMLDTWTDDAGNAMIDSFEAQCGAVVLDEQTPATVASGFLGLDEDDVAATPELVFIKTMTGEESNLGNPVLVSATEHTPPAEIETVTTFAGGPFIAAFKNEGSGEGLQRLLLYSECSEGTAPPDLKGEWRGVHKVETIQAINAETKLPVTNAAGVPTPVTKTTTKICVKLDSLPSVKCFIDVNDVDSSATQQIAIYRDGKPNTIGKVVRDLPSSSDPAPQGAAVTDLAVQDFFGFGSDSNKSSIFEDATNGPSEVGKLCNLINGAQK